jgi:hypothetical protein
MMHDPFLYNEDNIERRMLQLRLLSQEPMNRGRRDLNIRRLSFNSDDSSINSSLPESEKRPYHNINNFVIMDEVEYQPIEPIEISEILKCYICFGQMSKKSNICLITNFS